MTLSIDLAERGALPGWVVRAGIRRLLQKRLREEAARASNAEVAKRAWIESMSRAPIAMVPERANAQHYQVPAEFYRAVLGRQLKYSSAFWPAGVRTLDDAEEAMLRLTAERAQLEDGQRVLELGCGWGSLSLWMARKFPRSTIVGVSNSSAQRTFIEARAKQEGITNLTIVTADMNHFDTAIPRFDRVVSIEMFEHMRNWSALLRNVRRFIRDDGRLFIHVFAHRTYAYSFETDADDDWMGRNFFTGGMMPSVDLLRCIQSPFRIESEYEMSGTHYAKTAEAWLANLEKNRRMIEVLFEKEVAPREAKVRVERWKIFFLACAELFGFSGGTEWLVAHYLLAPRTEDTRS